MYLVLSLKSFCFIYCHQINFRAQNIQPGKPFFTLQVPHPVCSCPPLVTNPWLRSPWDGQTETLYPAQCMWCLLVLVPGGSGRPHCTALRAIHWSCTCPAVTLLQCMCGGCICSQTIVTLKSDLMNDLYSVEIVLLTSYPKIQNGDRVLEPKPKP